MRRWALGVAVVLLGSGCRSSHPSQPPAGHHEHTPPHGGQLVELGEEVAHVELLIDRPRGHVTAFVLDGEAEEPVRLAQSTLTIHFDRPAAPDLVLHAVPDVLTGETVGNTSEFQGDAPLLQTLTAFKAELKDMVIHGARFSGIVFNYPD